MRYVLPGIQLESDRALEPFALFESKENSDLFRVSLIVKKQSFSGAKVLFSVQHDSMNVAMLEDGWIYASPRSKACVLHVSRDYTTFTVYVTEEQCWEEMLLPLLRTALECASAAQGVVSLHSSCVVLEEKALCLTASSGTGKSTRALSWESGLGAEIISGDRPSISFRSATLMACGVPWDGKEQIYCNKKVPLLAICNIRRGDFTRVRKLSPSQARRVLMQQCFIPMWDTNAAAMTMGLVGKLSRSANVYRVICGPSERDAHELKKIVYDQPDRILEMEKDMKIKSGFVLRNTAGEYVVMPTGKNISQFDGAIILNEVAAFVWEKMKESVSKEELLEYILSEFDVCEDQASSDLDVLLEKLRKYGVIEDESI